MNGRRRLVLFATLVVTAGYAPLVSACPYCLGKEPTLPPSLKLVGVFLLVPFVVAGTVAAVARRLR